MNTKLKPHSDSESAHITPAGGNIFADLGFAPQEAAALQAQSRRIISDKIAIKEKLMDELALWIATENLKQADAAQILGVSRPRVSDVINKKTPKFTIDALVDMLARAGRRVQFQIA
ncbi:MULTISPECIES: helix-turn-helix domain-containing protein [unclassified Janthinobacterium]|uniref:helix-turn-helix domain-containing protein n=1 Tax=unclassified Janthinobacterium TaxID=2610881 RepID=UPI00161DCB05|nr:MULTISPECIES: XRE family transcriptional regulator [unclassified Janthinobacterium]MBB5370604.1 putative XRE-type DNA-binding protein [Janthinobacterium sp. K2C7]MBB5383182.1 putative XRE-type DNA-binding protein [Janthinobacterium sp. K2Li3]MBB5388636.1 putative XRE-type DNA-binding protein [Janthinobacterium sp. K2E3]